MALIHPQRKVLNKYILTLLKFITMKEKVNGCYNGIRLGSIFRKFCGGKKVIDFFFFIAFLCFS